MKFLRKSIQIVLLCVSIPNTFAQLGFCNGNSGEAIFTETFGTGTNYGPQLPAGTTTYNFIGNSGPQDGEYTIGSNTFSYGWNLPSDHTPNDTNGKCLIVNASFTPGEFYKTTISGLCENTTYEFSAWLINILPSSGCGGNGIPVNVKFEIWDFSNTNLLASGDTGNIFGISTPNWQQYGLVFQTLAGQSSVILKMLNNGIGGCGNDLAIDDIVFKSCGDSVVIENNSGVNSFEACENDMISNVQLTATPDFSVFSTHAYQWQVSSDELVWTDIPGATNNIYNAPAPSPSGTLYYRVKFAESANNLLNSSCNSISDSFEIIINSPDTPIFNTIPPICNGSTFALPTTSLNGISGTWSPLLNNTSTTTYTFSPNPNQCAQNQIITVEVLQPVTPNFAAINPICIGDTVSLPTTSLNNIIGTWSPAIDNTTTTTYTFTPNIGQCATTQALTIIVNQPTVPLFNIVTEICEGEPLNPLPTISLNNIIGTWSPALNNTTTTTYTFTPNEDECSSLFSITIDVNPKPIIDFEDYYAICSNSENTEITNPIIATNLSTTEYLFEWTNEIGVIVGTDSFYQPSLSGIYNLKVTNLSSGCISLYSTEVFEGSPPELNIIQTSSPFSENGIIEVIAIGNGSYEYSLDNGPWQDSSLFTNVVSGNHIITTRDKQGCGYSSIEICLIGYSKFFTPNGDGFNDNWTIKGSSCLSYAVIYIYDRFGKLLKQLNINSLGWDGTFNGEKLPVNDYWFVIKYLEPNTTILKEFKGHFTLKR